MEPDAAMAAGETWDLEFVLNGQPRRLQTGARTTLLDLLRFGLGLTGTKGACLEGECGSCTVLVDGRPMNACLILAPQVHGRSVTTIEGLAQDGRLHLLQQKFIEKGAVQCGYCTPGLIMAAKHLLDTMPDATEEDLLAAIEGNLCRCTGYAKIVEAIRAACEEARHRP